VTSDGRWGEFRFRNAMCTVSPNLLPSTRPEPACGMFCPFLRLARRLHHQNRRFGLRSTNGRPIAQQPPAGNPVNEGPRPTGSVESHGLSATPGSRLKIERFFFINSASRAESRQLKKTSKISEKAKPEQSGDAKPRVLLAGQPGCRRDELRILRPRQGQVFQERSSSAEEWALFFPKSRMPVRIRMFE
jgi:hypothetical protein